MAYSKGNNIDHAQTYVCFRSQWLIKFVVATNVQPFYLADFIMMLNIVVQELFQYV